MSNLKELLAVAVGSRDLTWEVLKQNKINPYSDANTARGDVINFLKHYTKIETLSTQIEALSKGAPAQFSSPHFSLPFFHKKTTEWTTAPSAQSVQSQGILCIISVLMCFVL